ncbi:FG-GAP-like repeat-containing protein [Gloeobacter violaceus]|nr:FG-GAP-like repeat-containing protein [Gloeobacter violaceus]
METTLQRLFFAGSAVGSCATRTGLIGLGLAVSLSLGTLPVRAQVDFAPAQNFYAGGNPNSVAVGDFDGDGDLDLALANGSYGDSGPVSVLLNDGQGVFSAPSTFGAGDLPVSVVAGDLDGDTDLDLAVANGGFDSEAVSVLKNNGDGTFGPPQAFQISGLGFPYAVTTGDLDGDGDLDLVAVSTYDLGAVSVLLNRGNGSFVETGFDYGGYGLNAVTVGDLDGDGDLDVAITSSGFGDNGYVVVFLNNGKGELSFISSINVGGNPLSIQAADFNGDGDTDLVSADASFSALSVLLGNGNGTFASPQSISIKIRPYSVTVGDFDGDGDLDLATANYGSDNISVLLNGGGGDFAPALDFAADKGTRSINVGDFDGDGNLDLVAANFQAANVSVLLNTTGLDAALSIDTFTPRRGPAGTEVTISGSGFAEATAVLFKGNTTRAVPADFTVVSDTEIMAIVPTGAVSGRILVKNPTGTATSRGRFEVTP